MICQEENCQNKANSQHFICDNCLNKRFSKGNKPKEPLVDIAKILGLLQAGKPIPHGMSIPLIQNYINYRSFLEALYRGCKAHQKEHELLVEIVRKTKMLLGEDYVDPVEKLEENVDPDLLTDGED